MARKRIVDETALVVANDSAMTPSLGRSPGAESGGDEVATSRGRNAHREDRLLGRRCPENARGAGGWL